ncbi:MAG: hypothetical protein WC755_04725 [Candidatus Woesearchaeota archaeon]|jgi:hypothetical protein
MTSNILFLGTGVDSATVASQSRATGGIVFGYNDAFFLINPRPGSIVRARQFNFNFRALIGILLTDNTILAANDTNVVIDAMTYSGEDKRGLLFGPKECFEGEKKIILDDYKNLAEKIIYMEQGKKVGIDDLEIYALKTNKLVSLGYKIATPDFTVCYTGEAEFSLDLADEYKDCDVLLISLKHEFGANSAADKGLTYNHVSKIISIAKPRVTVICDFSESVIQADPISQARQLQKETGFQVVAAKDGMNLNPRAYSKPKTQGNQYLSYQRK